MDVTVVVPLRPDGRDPYLREGRRVGPRMLLHYAALFRRAAAVVRVLRRDGWYVQYDCVDAQAEHAEVATPAAARERLAALGIDPRWVSIYDYGVITRHTAQESAGSEPTIE